MIKNIERCYDSEKLKSSSSPSFRVADSFRKEYTIFSAGNRLHFFARRLVGPDVPAARQLWKGRLPPPKHQEAIEYYQTNTHTKKKRIMWRPKEKKKKINSSLFHAMLLCFLFWKREKKKKIFSPLGLCFPSSTDRRRFFRLNCFVFFSFCFSFSNIQFYIFTIFHALVLK